MSAKKSETDTLAPAPAARRNPIAGNSRWLALGLVLVGAAIFGGRAVWQHVGEHVLAHDEYRLDPAAIEITAPPPWIRMDIKAEVIRDASLDGTLSILDNELSVRVARAFALHPWIAKVERVTKRFPAGVQVDLIYRRPAAMVEIAGPALLPVDTEGVLLPSDDFSPDEARSYPRLSEVKSSPLGPVGTPWGDPRVSGGARVAAALAEAWQNLKLARIVPSGRPVDGAGHGEAAAYEIYTQGGSRIVWGSPPGSESAGESGPADKIAKLVDYAAEKGSLDGATSMQLDVRSPGPVIATPRTKIRSLPHP